MVHEVPSPVQSLGGSCEHLHIPKLFNRMLRVQTFAHVQHSVSCGPALKSHAPFWNLNVKHSLAYVEGLLRKEYGVQGLDFCGYSQHSEPSTSNRRQDSTVRRIRRYRSGFSLV